MCSFRVVLEDVLLQNEGENQDEGDLGFETREIQHKKEVEKG